MSLDTPPRSRSGGRAARRALRTATDVTMLPGIHSRLPTCEILTGAEVERIDAASIWHGAREFDEAQRRDRHPVRKRSC